MSLPNETPPVATAPTRKPLGWVGAAQSDYRKLPEAVRSLAGRLLLDVQYGETPTDSEAMPTVGAGVIEVKLTVNKRWFRVFTVVKFEEAIYVLHSYQKKTNQTAPRDIEMGQERYKLLMAERAKMNATKVKK